ncbi:MAG: orotidine-5'-phosphate decarboxylase [Cellvibrionaceae bacterium]
MTDPKVLIALDFSTAEQVMAFIEPLSPEECRLKVGKELFTSCGPELVKAIIAKGFDVFLDMKYHDIPNTVAGAVRAAAEMGVWMVNVHAVGGSRMMKAAEESLHDISGRKPLLIAVTVLTSMSPEDLAETGVTVSPEEQVLHLAKLAKDSGMDGVVCSAQEAEMLKQHCGQDFQLVTPGIRPADAAADDQRRIVTPPQAIKNGSDYLVIGRPITKAENPVQALQAINQSLGA